MQLTIEGISHTFIPIKEFRATHQLPVAFDITLFEAKDYAGLGQIDSAGAALNQLRTAVTAALPGKLSPLSWLSVLPNLTQLFAEQLYQINDHIGLRDVEIEFAVAGFNDALQAYAYAFAYASTTKTPLPDFQSVYAEWLTGTVRVFSERHSYLIDGESCMIQVIAHAYGRIGLLIHSADTYAVYDPKLACPAEGFMVSLLTEIAAHMRQASD